MDFFSDLACEFARDNVISNQNLQSSTQKFGAQVTITDLSNGDFARAIGKRAGLYFTVQPNSKKCDIKSALSYAIGRYHYDWSKVLLIGLGNPKFLCDSLGTLVLDDIDIAEDIYKYYPLTEGSTGIPSIDIVKGCIDIVQPSLVVAIDSLATDTPSRIGMCYQLSNAGIIPGSGVGRSRELLDSKTIGVDILAVGVPFVCDISRYVGKAKAYGQTMVSPSNIESMLKACANNIRVSITSYLAK